MTPPKDMWQDVSTKLWRTKGNDKKDQKRRQQWMSTESSNPPISHLKRQKRGNAEGPFEVDMNFWRGQNGAWPQVQSTGRYICSALQFLFAGGFGLLLLNIKNEE